MVPIRKPILAISSCLISWTETFFLLVRNFLVLPEICWTLSWMSWQDHWRSYSGFTYILLSPFLIATHYVTLIVFCSSIMNLNIFWVSFYLWQIFAIRWTIYSSIQSVWGARSAKRSIALKTAFYLLFAMLHVVQDFLSIPKVQTVCFLTFKGLPICEKHFKVQLICRLVWDHPSKLKCQCCNVS